MKDTNACVDIFGWEDIWYRALNTDDMANLDANKGIIPKDPGASATPMDHVLKGSDDGYKDQYTSLTKERSFAERWARKGNTEVVAIDLDKVNENKLNLSTPEGRTAHLGDVSRAPAGSDLWKANKYAKGAKELLVEGTIPNEAIVERYKPSCN